MKRDQWLLYGLLALGAIAVIYWYTSLDWKEQEIDTGPTAEARQNPYLALQMVLRDKGINNDFQRGFSGLNQLKFGDRVLGRTDTLVLIHTYQGIYDSHLEALWQWVENGGHLIVTADNPFIKADSHLDDPLLDRLGLALETNADYQWPELGENDDEEDEGDEGDEGRDEPPANSSASPANADNLTDSENTATEKAKRNCDRATTAQMGWQDTTIPLTIISSDRARLYQYDEQSQVLAYQEDFAHLGNDEEEDYDNEYIEVARLRVGSGYIDAYASDISLTNDNIACYDNGYAFWQLVKDSPQVWLAVNADRPSFWREMWALSAVGCVALIAALALWVWQQGVRFGPVLPIDRSQRRHFIDHIRASGMFIYRNDGSATLMQTLREDIQQKMQIKYSQYLQLGPDQQLEKLQQLTAMPSDDIQLAMFHPLPLPAGLLVDSVRKLQHLRNSL